MVVRKLYKSKKLSKRLSKKYSNKKTKTNKKNKNISGGSYKINSNSKSKSKSKSKSNLKYKRYSKSKNYSKQKGGFMSGSSCNLATVSEPGFNLAGSGTGATSIAGLNIADSRAVIFNPNCKTDTYQAMIS